MRKSLIGALLFLPVLAGCTSTGTPERSAALPTHEIHASYIFDVSNPRYVAGYADAVVIGRVDDIAKTDARMARTSYRVTVQEALLGTAPPLVTVDQLGYRGKDGIHQTPEQPVLEIGQTYVLALTSVEGSEEMSVVAGPESVSAVTGANRGQVTAEWRQLVSTRQFPPGVPTR